MPKNNIRDYLFNKLFFPKVVVIDRPGIIINKTSRKYGGEISKKRVIFHFEDIFVNLQMETIKKFGKERVSDMYYKLGREIGIMHMLSGGAKKPPTFLIKPIIELVIKNLGWVGLSKDGITFNAKNQSLILKLRESAISRKTNDHSIFIGGFSSIFSFLTGKNMEGEVKHTNDPNEYWYIFNKDIKRRFIPDIKKLMPIKNYDRLNFPKEITPTMKTSTFSEFMKFKKIKLQESGKFYFTDKLILPSTTEFLNLIANRYSELKETKTLRKGIINGAKKLAKDILKNQKSKKDKIGAIINMLSAFGWGIPVYRKKYKYVIFDFISPPISKYGFLYEALVLNGYLNYIFDKELEIKEIKMKKNPIRITIQYYPI